ncbi:forespore capture DNA-binding protein RefZ [Bacillus sp. Bva_UNVM-123]|uniref:forespore capture DNA-binding protein RefZ n=1 Tax=Bacillus sp. Bva_UNVM-123 TaxID=2829798 RepID=UPI00391EF2E7
MRKNSKEKIVSAAIMLFNAKGFSGTSIRDIGEKAKVNSSNISYYFESKHGLLEYCLTDFFEGYIKEVERGFSLLEQGAAFCLKNIAKNIMNYQYKNIHLTRLILREVSIDSQVIREIMTTYLMKERYYFNKVFERGMMAKEFRPFTSEYIILQLKGLLSMPFLNTQYMTEVLHVLPNEKYFADKYIEELYYWIEGVLCDHKSENALLAVN